jgi:type VI secretion system VgrG family protein
MQEFAVVRFESAALGDATVQVRSLEGRECISQLFEFELHIVCANPDGLDPQTLMSSAASIVVMRTTTADNQSREERRLHGMISRVTDRLTLHTSHTEYVVTFVPRAWQATLTCLNDIFMNLTVPEIIAKKLKDNCQLTEGQDFEFRLMASYPKREFVVQYQETDLSFLSRLAEDQGICFFFEHRDGRDVMVFSDHNSGFRPAEPESAPLASRGAELGVFDLEADHRQITRTYRTRDYNYRNPGVDVFAEAQVPALGAGVIEEFGIHAKTPDEAALLARVRVEEEACHHHVYRGKSEISGLRAGSVLKLEGHPRGELELILTEIRHRAVQAVLGSGGTGAEFDYQNELRAIPKKLTYRPPRLAPKPVVPGVVTGLVQSASEKEMGAMDEQGQYRVAFMYDSVSGREEAKASRPLRMAQPSAGADRSFHLPLKAGVEVLVTCVNGDPDRPIIAGAVPNPRTSSPVTAANSEKSGMRTNKNEWFFDDRDARFKLCVDGETNVFQVGAPNAEEQGIAMATATNVSTMCNGVSTTVSSAYTTYSEYKTELHGKSIVNVAGIKTPWSKWKILQKVLFGLKDFAKTATDLVNRAERINQGYCNDAKKSAQAQLQATQERVVKALGFEYPRDKKPVDNADGTTRPETKDEFNQRILKESRNPADPTNKNTHARPLSAAESDALQAGANATQTAEAASKAANSTDDAPWNLSENKTAKSAVEVIENFEKMLEAKKKWSEASEALADVAQAADYAALKAHQAGAVATSVDSTGRTSPALGSFGWHYNVQGATDSVAVWGQTNSYIHGEKHVTMFSPGDVAVVARNAAHLKALKCVEVASKDEVRITGHQIVDAFSPGKMKLVAHPDGASQAIPGGFTMLLHSKEGIQLESTDKDLNAVAKLSISLSAKDKELHAHGQTKLAAVAGGGAGAGMVAEPKGVYLGLIASGAADGKSAASKDNAIYVTKDYIGTKAAGSEWALYKNGNISGKAKSAVEIKAGKGMKLTASSDVEVKASGQLKCNGSKVMLG